MPTTIIWPDFAGGMGNYQISFSGFRSWLRFFSRSLRLFLHFGLYFYLSYLLFFFLIENFKNIKDIEGDRRMGIRTLPALLGTKNGKFVTGLLAWLAALS